MKSIQKMVRLSPQEEKEIKNSKHGSLTYLVRDALEFLRVGGKIDLFKCPKCKEKKVKGIYKRHGNTNIKTCVDCHKKGNKPQKG
jgi:hypothetical protein